MPKVPFKALLNGNFVTVGETELDENGTVVRSVIHDTDLARELGFTPGVLPVDETKES